MFPVCIFLSCCGFWSKVFEGLFSLPSPKSILEIAKIESIGVAESYNLRGNGLLPKGTLQFNEGTENFFRATDSMGIRCWTYSPFITKLVWKMY